MFLVMFSMYTLNFTSLFAPLCLSQPLIYMLWGHLCQRCSLFHYDFLFHEYLSNIICIDLLATIISILKYIVNVKWFSWISL